MDNLAKVASIDLSNNQLTGAVSRNMLVRKNVMGLKGNKFEPHFIAEIADEMGGYYEQVDSAGNTYVLNLNEDARRFTLMKGGYDEEGGKYWLLRGEYKLEKDRVVLVSEILETGIMEDEIPTAKTHSEAQRKDISVTFDEGTRPLRIRMTAFEKQLELVKTR
jgi:hypothetical protein